MASDAVLINTENATLSAIESSVEISTLPINSRAVSSSPLAALATNPNVTSDSQGNVSVGGSTSSQTGFSVDGISTANVRANGSLKDAYPSMEGIQEMSVTAFNNNAEFAQISEINVNAGLAKQFSLTERFRLRFEATFTNVHNHPNFAPPSLNISNQSTFGVLTSTLPQGLGGNRTGQLALRLDF